MSGKTPDDSFEAFQEAMKVVSAKRGSVSRTISGDDIAASGGCRSAVVKVEPSSSQGKKQKSGGVTTRSAQQSADVSRSSSSLSVASSHLNAKIFPHDGTILPTGGSSEVVQAISQLYHLGKQLPREAMMNNQEELDDLRQQLSGDKIHCSARDMEIRDLKEKIKGLEKMAEGASADALAMDKKNQELEEEMETLKADAENSKPQMVIAVNGARIMARWELMREWLNKQSDQWDLAKAFEQYKTVVMAEADSKGLLPPTIEDEPVIPPSSGMNVDPPTKSRRSPA